MVKLFQRSHKTPHTPNRGVRPTALKEFTMAVRLVFSRFQKYTNTQYIYVIIFIYSTIFIVYFLAQEIQKFSSSLTWPFQSTSVWWYQGPVDTKIQHSNAAALQKILFVDACAHSEEEKSCGMPIHDQNLNVGTYAFDTCSVHSRCRLVLPMSHVFEKLSGNCL